MPSQTAVKKLAIQTIGIFAEVEKAAFEKRIMSLMPEIKEIVKPDLNDEVGFHSSNFSVFRSIPKLICLSLRYLITPLFTPCHFSTIYYDLL